MHVYLYPYLYLFLFHLACETLTSLNLFTPPFWHRASTFLRETSGSSTSFRIPDGVAAVAMASDKNDECRQGKRLYK